MKVQKTTEEEKYDNMQKKRDVSEKMKGEEPENVRSEFVKTEHVQKEGEESDTSRNMRDEGVKLVHVQDKVEVTKNEWSEMETPAQKHDENEEYAEG